MNRLDAFPKALEAAVVRTSSGGLVTLVTGVVVALLVMQEFYKSFIALDTESHMYVDRPADSHDHVDIHVHMTFPWLDCSELEIHAEHSKGETGYAETEYFTKRKPTSAELKPLREALGPEFNYPLKVQPRVIQNAKHGPGTPEKRTVHGCTVQGAAKVPKVAGDLHFWVPAPRVSPMSNLGALAEMFPGLVSVDVTPHNITHVIHRLDFGPTYSFMTNALEGAIQVVNEGLAQYQYNVQLVPTVIRSNGFISSVTNQYSVNEDEMVLDAVTATTEKYHPGVYFYYEISPIAVEYTRNSQGVLGFLVSLCALIGGALAVMRFVDTFAYRVLSKKED